MNCAVCGKTATSYNKAKQPVCGSHLKTTAKNPECPECGLTMSIRQGKFGAFWGCIAFPACSGTKRL